MKTLIALLVFGMLASVALAGNITGTVMYDGDAPARPELTATKDQHCVDAVKGTKSEALVVSKGKGIKNVVIYARVRGGKVTLPEKNPVMDQKGCAYYPHVLAVPVGATVDLTSKDPVAHNVHSHAQKNKAINIQIPKPGIVYPHKIEKAEEIKFTCDIHAWMTGYIVAVPSNFYTVTGYKDAEGKEWLSSDAFEKSADTGSYTLENVPAGRARVVAWHEELGSANKTIEVPASGDIAVNFTSADFKKKAK
ncbi:hypothetical protein F4Z99_15215 [Candidatus Poribacteria bacterium]|nr:hypothetical protein [Candidatus Poribacteria bacterium]MYB00137.1 hypothetical protein [Candidatus Poribacteria bacterium]